MLIQIDLNYYKSYKSQYAFFNTGKIFFVHRDIIQAIKKT